MRARRQSRKPTIEVWSMPFGGWNVVVLKGKRIIDASGPCPGVRALRSALNVAAVVRRAVEGGQHA